MGKKGRCVGIYIYAKKIVIAIFFSWVYTMSSTMNHSAFLKSSVLSKGAQGWRYVTPVQTAQKIREMRRVCEEGPYLDCVLDHAECSKITREFADMHKAPHLVDPDAFVAHLDLYGDMDKLGEDR